MKRSARQFPFGEELAVIPLGAECLQVCAEPRTPGRYNVLLCPGPILELCASPWLMLAKVAERVVQVAESQDVPARGSFLDDTIRLHLNGRELVLDPNDAVTALQTIVDATRTLFMPAFDRQIELAREMSAHT